MKKMFVISLIVAAVGFLGEGIDMFFFTLPSMLSTIFTAMLFLGIICSAFGLVKLKGKPRSDM